MAPMSRMARMMDIHTRGRFIVSELLDEMTGLATIRSISVRCE